MCRDRNKTPGVRGQGNRRRLKREKKGKRPGKGVSGTIISSGRPDVRAAGSYYSVCVHVRPVLERNRGTHLASAADTKG